MTVRDLLKVSSLLSLSACAADGPTTPEQRQLPNDNRPPAGTYAQVDAAFVNVSVIAMDSPVPAPDRTVIVRDGVIVEIGDVDDVAVPADVVVIDGTGAFLMPGLMDAHTHIGLRITGNSADDADANLAQYLANGVTTVLNMGDYDEDIIAWRRDVTDGSRAGPTIYAAMQVRGPGDGGPANRQAGDPAAGRALVSSGDELGYDAIKVYNGLSSATFSAVMAEAGSRNMAVVGHAVREPGMATILDAGMAMVAHAEEYLYSHFAAGLDPLLIPAAVDISARNEAFVTATVSTFEAISLVWGNNQSGYDALLGRPGRSLIAPGRRDAWDRQVSGTYNRAGAAQVRSALDFQKQFLKDFVDGGVRILLGTDSPVIVGMAPGYAIHDEVRVLAAAGLSRFDVLRAGTAWAGEFSHEKLGKSQRFGLVAEGFRADLILLGANPLESLDHLRSPRGVMAAGRWFTAALLDSLVAQ